MLCARQAVNVNLRWIPVCDKFSEPMLKLAFQIYAAHGHPNSCNQAVWLRELNNGVTFSEICGKFGSAASGIPFLRKDEDFDTAVHLGGEWVASSHKRPIEVLMDLSRQTCPKFLAKVKSQDSVEVNGVRLFPCSAFPLPILSLVPALYVMLGHPCGSMSKQTGNIQGWKDGLEGGPKLTAAAIFGKLGKCKKI
jgi:hypothetical protein